MDKGYRLPRYGDNVEALLENIENLKDDFVLMKGCGDRLNQTGERECFFEFTYDELAEPVMDEKAVFLLWEDQMDGFPPELATCSYMSFDLTGIMVKMEQVQYMRILLLTRGTNGEIVVSADEEWSSAPDESDPIFTQWQQDVGNKLSVVDGETVLSGDENGLRLVSDKDLNVSIPSGKKIKINYNTDVITSREVLKTTDAGYRYAWENVGDEMVPSIAVLKDKLATALTITSSDIEDWDGKQEVITDLSDIRNGATLGATALQPSDLSAVATSGSYNDLSDKPNITKNGSGDIFVTGAEQVLITAPNVAYQKNTVSLNPGGVYVNTSGTDKLYYNNAEVAKKSDIPTIPSLELGVPGAHHSQGNAITDIGVSGHTITPVKDKTFLESESDPVFQASAAAGITTSDITNWNGKQDALVSGTNVKTINNESILGSGNITIQGGGGGDVNVIEGITMNGSSITPDANKVVNLGTVITAHQDISGKQDVISDLAAIRSGAALGATALQSFTETDPTVPAWAKAANKPSYTASEVGALPDTTAIPTKVSDLTNDSGFTSNTGTITGITMNGASKGTSGVVNLGTVLTEHQDISGKANSADLATVATSGSYNDLSNKPTIPAAQVNSDWNASSGVAQILNKPTIPTVPTALSAFTDDLGSNPTHTHSQYLTSAPVISVNGQTGAVSLTIPAAVTESTVSGWGFTKNIGNVGSTTVSSIITLTEAQYEALSTKDSSTLYIITSS